ncbi:hypothetical protein BAUCODRAFT_463740 [Baudoinia panamericana UAMH 10762]|uniref:Uncharacterized protein n=1 Tax=Baudoinia panamericana (strain UAMH 10762) TaxID=717646 RepID=M2N1A6_BAUPA|nr:uncharacterized protein BAUCODRAFT_463740 [Baudoinia panamericana UAMH 10762]EMC97723.1 hypothetical protein BAUCODRAFT_463740 [Baudoinia panamericana UAMH 10762]
MKCPMNTFCATDLSQCDYALLRTLPQRGMSFDTKRSHPRRTSRHLVEHAELRSRPAPHASRPVPVVYFRLNAEPSCRLRGSRIVNGYTRSVTCLDSGHES